MMISNKRLSQLLIAAGAALVAGGVGYVFFSIQAAVPRDISWWSRLALFFVSGSACVCWGLFSDKYVVVNKATSPVTERPERNKDVEAIRHLADRMRAHAQGLKLCRELSDCLFTVHHESVRPVITDEDRADTRGNT
jgi:hypothetical protein